MKRRVLRQDDDTPASEVLSTARTLLCDPDTFVVINLRPLHRDDQNVIRQLLPADRCEVSFNAMTKKRKQKKLTEDQILQISNNIAEDMYGDGGLPHPPIDHLYQVIGYWQDGFVAAHQKLQLVQIGMIHLQMDHLTKLTQRYSDLKAKGTKAKTKKPGKLKLKKLKPEDVKRMIRILKMLD